MRRTKPNVVQNIKDRTNEFTYEFIDFYKKKNRAPRALSENGTPEQKLYQKWKWILHNLGPYKNCEITKEAMKELDIMLKLHGAYDVFYRKDMEMKIRNAYKRKYS